MAKKKIKPAEPAWKAVAYRHAKYEVYAKRKKKDQDPTILAIQANDGFKPSLVTGRCRCDDCKAARAAGYTPEQKDTDVQASSRIVGNAPAKDAAPSIGRRGVKGRKNAAEAILDVANGTETPPM